MSKADGSQVHDLQRDALVAAGVDPEHIYEDAASGRLDKRPGLDACLKALRRDDTLVIWKLDRLGRDLRHLVNIGTDPVSSTNWASVIPGWRSSASCSASPNQFRCERGAPMMSMSDDSKVKRRANSSRSSGIPIRKCRSASVRIWCLRFPMPESRP